MNYPQTIKNWLLDIIFPVRCVNCREFGQYLCRKCLNQMRLKQGFECIGCKQSASTGQTCNFCKKENPIDRLLIAAGYQDRLVQKTIKTFKFKFVSELASPLSLLMKKRIRRALKTNKLNIFAENPIIIPVPIHKRRKNWRGFNQSELLAKALADSFQMDYSSEILMRVRHTAPQTDMKEKVERTENIKSAFGCLEPAKISGRSVLLIDDICTTGATLNECAKILKKNGARDVTALVIARG